MPLAVLCRLLGIPDEDVSQFKNRVADLFDISATRPKGTARSRIELARYMTYLTDYKRQHPGDDLLSILISAHDRGELSKSEMITMGLALLAAGFETTAGQLSLMVMVMLAEPGTYRKLLSQPEILPVVIDEILRLSPVAPMSFTRAAQESVRLGRVVIEPGQAIAVSLFQANRDDQVFTKPDELTLEERAWPQLAFGYGSHRCPGAHLARTQLSVVLARLAQRFPALRLASVPDPVSWKQGIATRGPSRLMVTW